MCENRVLLIGASGFIGSHILEYFISKQINVDCMVRKTSNVGFIKKFEVKIIKGDIADLKILKNFFKNYDCIIHTAGYVKDWGNFKTYFKNNVLGTLNVLKACKFNKIKQIIITGTNSIYGEEDNACVKSELSPFNSNYKYFGRQFIKSAMNFYRNSKAMAVKYATDFATRNLLNLTVMEPVWVFGEREFGTGFYEYLKTVKSGIPFLPGTTKNRFHVIYARDLAKCYYLAYKAELSGVNRFIAANDKSVNMNYLYSLFCRNIPQKKPINLPKYLIYPLGFLLEFFYTCFKSKTPPILTRARVNMFYDNIEYTNAKIKKILGFEQSYTLERSIKKTVEWYKNEKLL